MPKIVVERVHGSEELVRIPLVNFADPKELLGGLNNAFEACFRNGHSKIIVDCKQVSFPSASLIALLIEATSRARRLNGEVILTGLSRSAKANLATFSPLSYLCLETPENISAKSPEHNLENIENKGDDFELLPTDEIAEDPIVEKFDDSFHDVTHSQEQPKNLAREDNKHLRVSSDSKNLYTICDFVTRFAQKAGFNARDIGKTKIAVYEACLNVIEHAYRSNPDNWIDVWVDYDDERFKVIVQDYGIGFEGLSLKDYDVMSAMDHRQTGGFGLYIIRRSMNEIDYQADRVKGNRLTLTKYINKNHLE
jgi:serine/threonine-protein kinase RsbW